MRVHEIMTREPKSIPPDASVWDAVRILEEAAIHELPVVENGGVVGIITQRDLLRVLGRRAQQPPEDHMGDVRERVVVRGCMTPDVITVTEDTPLADACQVMADARIGSVPVIGTDGALVGMLSVTDVLQRMAHQLRQTAA